MRLPLLAALALLAMAGTAAASNHYMENDGNGTSFPEPEESVENGPRNNDPISWFQPGIILLFLAAASGVIFYMWRTNRDDRRKGL